MMAFEFVVTPGAAPSGESPESVYQKGDSAGPIDAGQFLHVDTDPEVNADWVLDGARTGLVLRSDLEAARAFQKSALNDKAAQVMRGGIPVEFNGVFVILRFTARDEARWSKVDLALNVPPGGLLVPLKQPYNGKNQVRVMGKPKVTVGKQRILDFGDAVDTAWEARNDAIDAATTVAAVQAVPIESASGWPDWPSNTAI